MIIPSRYAVRPLLVAAGRVARYSTLAAALSAAALALPAQVVIGPSAPGPASAAGYVPGLIVPGTVQATPFTVPQSTPLYWGPFLVRPHASYRFLYGDGLRARLGQESTTAIHSLSPGILLNIGTKFTLDYTPTWNLYSSHAFRDTLDHALSFNANTTYEAWLFQLVQGFSSTSQPLAETGSQTDQKTYDTAVSVTYRFTPRTLLETTFNQNLRFAEVLNDSREWSTVDWFHVQPSAKLDAALGAGLGFVDVSQGSDNSFYQFLGRIAWNPSAKVALQIQGGFETRTFRSGGGGDLNSNPLSASLQYSPLETTIFSAGVSRSVGTSYFANQVTKSEGFNLGFRQRFLEHYWLNIAYNDRQSDYITTTTGAAGRSDKNRSFDVRLSTGLLRRGTVAIVYRRGDNSSNTPGYGYKTEQYGCELGYRF